VKDLVHGKMQGFIVLQCFFTYAVPVCYVGDLYGLLKVRSMRVKKLIH